MIITCDFDHTLRFETGEVNQQTLDLLSAFDAQIIIISTRRDTDINRQEIVDFLTEHNILTTAIHLVRDEHQKLAKAIEVNSTLHLEDSDEAIKLFDKAGKFVVNCFDKEAWKTHLKNLEI